MYIKCIFNLTTAELPGHHCERTKLGSRKRKERKKLAQIDRAHRWNQDME